MTFGVRHIGTGKGFGGFWIGLGIAALAWILFFGVWFALGFFGVWFALGMP
jgi:hypothetical protein